MEAVSNPEVNVSNEVKEELLEAEGDRVEMSVVEVIVAFLVGVITVVKKVLAPDMEVEGGSPDVAVVNVLVVTGVGVESTVVSKEWEKVGAEGTLPVWLVPVWPAERDEEDADVTRRLVANGLEWFPVPEGVAVLLGVVCVVSKFWVLEREGTSVVWAVGVREPSWVVGMSVVTSGTVLLAEEVARAVTGMVERSMVDKVTVSVTPEVVGLVEILSVEYMLEVAELEVRDGVWVATVTRCVVDVLTASEVGSEGQVDMREVSGASVSVKEEGEEISDVTASVKELKSVA